MRLTTHLLTVLICFPVLSGVTYSQSLSPPTWNFLVDADQDGLTDVDEIFLGLDPLEPADGLSDLDGDGLSLGWEFSIGTHSSEADTDADGWSDSEEYLIYGTQPTSWLSFPLSSGSPLAGAPAPASALPVPPAPTPPPPSLSNGDFTETSITTWKNATGSYQNGAFKWGAGAIGNWTAYKGSTVEVWEVGTEKFIELDGNINNYGVKQPIDHVKDGGYVLTWRQCGRTHDKADNDPYQVKVYYLNGSTEIPIATSPTYSGFDKKSWTDNALGFQITPAQLVSAGNNPIFVAFVPVGNNTYGTLIDKVNLLVAEFKLKDPADVFKGWDNTDDEPWTSVGVGQTKSIVKFVGGNSEYELAVDSGSAKYLSIANEAVTGGDTNFTITGIADSNASGVKGAQIIFRKKGKTSALATLHVHVLPPRIVDVKVYHASDDFQGRVPLSALPANIPTVAQIVNALNDVYKEQANITFVPLSPNPVIINKCKDGFASDGKCYDRTVPGNTVNYTDNVRKYADTGNHFKFFIVADVVGPGIEGPKTRGLSVRPSENSIVDATAPLSVFPHEAGHALNTGSDIYPHEPDYALGPYDVKPLMHETSGSNWIRKRDWRASNTQAAKFWYGH